MSPEAIDQRLREVGELYQLGTMLQSAKRIGPVRGKSKVGDVSSPTLIHDDNAAKPNQPTPLN